MKEKNERNEEKQGRGGEKNIENHLMGIMVV